MTYLHRLRIVNRKAPLFLPLDLWVIVRVHWGMDGNGKDSVGKNDLSIEGGTFETGKYGQALSLDGSGAHAVDDDGGDYINGLDAITVAMWIKSNQVNTDTGFFLGNDPSGADKDLCLRYDVSGANGGGTT